MPLTTLHNPEKESIMRVVLILHIDYGMYVNMSHFRIYEKFP